MKKAYLFVYSNTLGTRDQIKVRLDALPEVLSWRYELPNAYYVISEASADELSTAIRGVMQNNGRFIISEITSNKQGWLSAASWYLINNKENKPVEQ